MRERRAPLHFEAGRGEGLPGEGGNRQIADLQQLQRPLDPRLAAVLDSREKLSRPVAPAMRQIQQRARLARFPLLFEFGGAVGFHPASLLDARKIIERQGR